MSVNVALEDYQQFEQSFQEYLDSHPDCERSTTWGPFSAAWHARVRVARQSINSYSEEPHEAIMLYVVQKLEDHIKHLNRMLSSEWKVERGRKRRISTLEHMIRELEKDPDDAPLWRRISEQRKQIKRLTRDNNLLRGNLLNHQDTGEAYE